MQFQGRTTLCRVYASTYVLVCVCACAQVTRNPQSTHTLPPSPSIHPSIHPSLVFLVSTNPPRNRNTHTRSKKHVSLACVEVSVCAWARLSDLTPPPLPIVSCRLLPRSYTSSSSSLFHHSASIEACLLSRKPLASSPLPLPLFIFRHRDTWVLVGASWVISNPPWPSLSPSLRHEPEGSQSGSACLNAFAFVCSASTKESRTVT